MNTEEVWQTVEAQRLDLADLLETLSEPDWDVPSLCTGWTVRDVAAHVGQGPRETVPRVIADVIRAGGDFDRSVRDSARRRARLPRRQLIDELREMAASQRLTPFSGPIEPLFDILVHGQDIAMPLGIDRPMPLRAARTAAERIWTMGFPFNARKRFVGYRLRATDADWTAGLGGAEITGSMAALLLLVSGRPAALEGLTGERLDELRTRLAPA